MSVHMKKPPIKPKTKSTKRFALSAKEIGGDVERSFILPEEKANGLMSVIDDFEVPVSGRGEIEELFAELNREGTEVGVMLRAARLREDLTQKELADKLGIPQGHISAMEHGKKSIGKKMAQRLANVLNISHKVFV